MVARQENVFISIQDTLSLTSFISNNFLQQQKKRKKGKKKVLGKYDLNQSMSKKYGGFKSA